MRSNRTSVAALLAALASFALAACNRAHPIEYRTDTTDKGSIVEQVSATGDVEAIISVNVGSQVSGTISKLYVDFNSIVKKDQLLCDLDPRLFKAALENADAGLAAANANVVKAKAALDDSARQEKRARDLLAQNLDSQADVDTAMSTREQNEANLAAMKAAVMQARANRDSAAANLVFTHIKSPIDGIVVSRAVDVGTTVAAQMTVATLFVIANDLTKMQILANIDEADVGKVDVGANNDKGAKDDGLVAHFSVDAWPGEDFIGKIREVRQSPNTINNVVTYAAVIDAPNPKHKLKPGMTASVQITTRRRDEVLRVPNAALRFKPSTPVPAAGGDDKGGERTLASARENGPRPVAGGPQGDRPRRHREESDAGAAIPAAGGEVAAVANDSASTPSADERRGQGRTGKVYKLVDGKPVQARVRLGLQDSQHTEVLEGLAENDVVIVGESGGAAAPGSNSLMGGPRPPGGGGGRR